MITIKDLLLAPFEIDVDKRNITLVESKLSANGNRNRYVVGHFTDFWTAISTIINIKVQRGVDDIEGQVVDLKTYLHAQVLVREKTATYWKQLRSILEFSEEQRGKGISPAEAFKGLTLVISGKKEKDEEEAD